MIKEMNMVYTNPTIGIGSFGVDVVNWGYARSLQEGTIDVNGMIPGTSCPRILALETDRSSLTHTVQASSDGPSVQLPRQRVHIIQPRNAEEQVQALAGNRFTRHLAKRLVDMPEFSTESGGGAVVDRAYSSAIMDRALAPLLEQFILGQRDIHSINTQTVRGQHVATDLRIRCAIVGNGAGSTFNSMVNLVGIYLQRFARQHGLALELLQIVLDPSVAVVASGDSRIAKANYIMTLRHSLALVEHWANPKVALPTFAGMLTPVAPLWKRIVPWTTSNGRVSCPNRAALAATVSLGIDQLLGSYGAFAESVFVDGEKDAATTTGRGPAILGRLGVWRAAAPQGRAEKIALESGMREVAGRILDGPEMK